MIVTELPAGGLRVVDGPGRPSSTVRRGASARPERPVPSSRRTRTVGRTRSAYCPHPVTSARPAARRTPAWARRALAGTGAFLASAAVVVGLGLLADAAAPQAPSPTAPVPATLDIGHG